MRALRTIAVGLALTGPWGAAAARAESKAFDDSRIMELFFVRAAPRGTAVVYRIAAASVPHERHRLQIGDAIGSYRLVREEDSDYGRALRLASSNDEVVVQAHTPKETCLNMRWAAVPGLSAFVECTETNVSLDGSVTALVVLTNAGPNAVEIGVAGFSSLLYQGSDAEENLLGFRNGEHGWRGEGDRQVLAPGGAHAQSFGIDLTEIYLPSIALAVGPAALRATLHLVVDGNAADLACRETKLHLYEPELFEAKPMLLLEKKVYVRGEAIRCWVGAGVAGNRPIPKKQWESCRLRVARPDGTCAMYPMGWPADGMIDMDGEGGWNFGEEDVEVGTNTLVFEFAGKQTEPIALVVRRLDVLDNLPAKFVFGKKGEVEQYETVPIVLKVENRTGHPARFAFFGTAGTPIALRVTRKDPPRRDDLFYPWTEPPGAEAQTSSRSSSWAVLGHMPFVTLPPGENYELALPLDKAYRFPGPGEYEVEFATTIPVLLGEADGAFADVCPIRLRVRSKETFVVR